MTDKEIKKQLDKFILEIYAIETVAQARDIDKRLDEFISDNSLTEEQLQPLFTSGAGDMLGMIASM